MPCWPRFRLLDLLVAIVLIPPGAVLAFQTTLRVVAALEDFSSSAESLEDELTTFHVETVTVCPRPIEIVGPPPSDAERLVRMSARLAYFEAGLASGEIDPADWPEAIRLVDDLRRDIASFKMKIEGNPDGAFP